MNNSGGSILRAISTWIFLGTWLATPLAGAQDFTPEGIEFFERKIRPVLADCCFQCHSAQSEKLKGGLHLDSRAGALKGGDTRAAVVPGKPDLSLVVEAIRYQNPDLQMPPKGKLPSHQIADFVAWIQMGAPWPPSDGPTQAAQRKSNSEFDLDRRRREHWAWQSLRNLPPPDVRNSNWPHNAIDHFILARLEARNLTPGPDADRRMLIRRLYFDLLGLPPTPSDVDRFVSDSKTGAYDRLIDRLLSSPQFGERWARHWLDLVRYSETLGHEFDYSIPNAWRYRDYVIRAFNADVPYDRFVQEHVAGDLLRPARRNPGASVNESMIGAGFYWFGQQTHSPVDVRQHQAEVVENQIDVLSKTFLGLTVACARCHDHKFDAISTRDYYALYGVLTSSRYGQRSIDQSEDNVHWLKRLQHLKQRIRKAIAHVYIENLDELERYAAAAAKQIGSTQNSSAAQQPPAEPGFNAEKLDRWGQAIKKIAAGQSPANRPHADEPFEKLADFSMLDYSGWFAEDEAFGERPAVAGDFILGPPEQPISTLLTRGTAHSAILSRRFEGVLRSPTFTIQKTFLHIRVAGHDSRFNVCVDNFVLIQNPIYGALRHVVNQPAPTWITIDVAMWKGHRAYLEFSDLPTPDLAGGGKGGGYGPESWIAVEQVIASDQKQPPASGETPRWMDGYDLSAPELFASKLRKEAEEGLANWATNELPAANSPHLPMLAWLIDQKLLGPFNGQTTGLGELARLIAEFRSVESSIQPHIRVPAMSDGNGLDEAVFIRGSPRTLGELVPRRFLEAIPVSAGRAFGRGSGRRELAECLTDPANPLTARVMVNRVWHHLFGRGIVATPDDFGVLGQAPSHPELLDWLATHFRTELAWSIKNLVRLLVSSRTYQMSSQAADTSAEQQDPSNLLWHRMPVKRLEGESIRDAILALSAQLKPAMYGPSVPVHLDEFMDGRGRPGKSGPLDGAGRRSVYLEIRRNFLSPFMRTFDAPVPFTTVGRRTVSNVPAQSLILLNHPFVVEQARWWAEGLLTNPTQSIEDRIHELYLTAFSRPPNDLEVREATEFLDRQAQAFGTDARAALARPEVWADLCHVLLNVKEFVFVR